MIAVKKCCRAGIILKYITTYYKSAFRVPLPIDKCVSVDLQRSYGGKECAI